MLNKLNDGLVNIYGSQTIQNDTCTLTVLADMNCDTCMYNVSFLSKQINVRDAREKQGSCEVIAIKYCRRFRLKKQIASPSCLESLLNLQVAKVVKYPYQ